MQDHDVLIYLTVLIMLPSVVMDESRCFKIQMCFRNKHSRNNKTEPNVCTTYWSLEHTVLFWDVFKCVFIFSFNMSYYLIIVSFTI